MSRLLGTATYTVSRYTFSLVDHEMVRALSSTFSVVGSCQPLNGRDLQRLPEGQRTRASKKLFCYRDQPALRLAGVDGVTAADRISIDGDTYEVIRVEDWTAHSAGIPHRLYYLERVGGDES